MTLLLIKMHVGSLAGWLDRVLVCKELKSIAGGADS